MNKTSERLMYNQRLLIDNLGVTNEPLAWKISKYTRTQVNGVILITFAQDQFDSTHDYVEYDEDGKVIGMYADYFTGDVTPTNADEPQLPTTRPVLSYKGKQDYTLKVGGNARTFICQYYDIDDNIVDYRDGYWNILINGENAGDNVILTTLSENGHIKIKMKNDRNLVGSKCSVGFTSTDGISANIDMNVAGL